MNRLDARTAQAHWRGCAGRRPLGFAGLGFMAFCATAGLLGASAQAQSLRSWEWHADEGPPPIPPGNVGRQAASYRAVPLATIRHHANLAGFHLVATPHRKDNVYVAFGEDTHGLLHRLVFDAHEGILVKNETSDIREKVSPIHPAAGPSARSHLASPPTVTARELSPIEPQPGVKTAPGLKDGTVDKD